MVFEEGGGGDRRRYTGYYAHAHRESGKQEESGSRISQYDPNRCEPRCHQDTPMHDGGSCRMPQRKHVLVTLPTRHVLHLLGVGPELIPFRSIERSKDVGKLLPLSLVRTLDDHTTRPLLTERDPRPDLQQFEGHAECRGQLIRSKRLVPSARPNNCDQSAESSRPTYSSVRLEPCTPSRYYFHHETR